MIQVTSYRNALNKALGKKEVLEEQSAQYARDKERLEKRSLAIEKLQVIIQETAKSTQEQLRFHVEDIVRSCMETVFEEAYDFNLDFEIKRNKTEANLRFSKEGRDIDIMSSSGGGCVDVASLGLKLSAWSLGNSDNTMILDESLKYLSKDLQPRMGEVLNEIASKLGLQVIMVSHSDALIECADKIFSVKKKDNVSEVEVR